MQDTKIAEQLIKAYREGVAAGELDTTPGQPFRSAWPAAADHGYSDDSRERSMFTIGYLEAIPLGFGVVCDPQGVTLRIQ